MAITIDDWLGPLVERELQAVLAWNESIRHRIKLEPGTQGESDDRFRDDGSNFHNTLASPPLSSANKLQLREVFEVNDGARVLLSDGFTQMTAFLYQPALRTLEEATGQGLTTDMAGDVFVLRSADIISTPYGDSDMHVLLAITEIDYLNLLRKIIGDSPTPIQERQAVSKSLEAIRELRIGALDALDESESQGQAASQIEPACEQQTLPAATKSASSSSQYSPEIETQFLETQIQSPLRLPRKNPKKRTGAQLSSDGYEVETGINLNRPTAANLVSTTAGAMGNRKFVNVPERVTTGPAMLLNLLKAKDTDSTPASPPPSEMFPQNSPAVTQPSSVQQLQESSAPVSQSRVPYGRRKIPWEQQRVIDKPSSWFPALPGQQFPIPNLPIELLKLWNAEKSSLSLAASEKAAVEDTQDQQPLNNVESSTNSSLGSSSSDSLKSDESDREISDWEPTQPSPQQPELPPDSTLGSNRSPVVAASQRSSIQSPGKMPISPIRPQSQATSYSSASQQRRIPHPLPKRPDFRPSSDARKASNGASQYSQGVHRDWQSESQSVPQHHLARELSQARYECPTCNESFSHQQDIREHISKHIGENRFVCDFAGCGQTFAQSYRLLEHQKSHPALGSTSVSAAPLTETLRSSPAIRHAGDRQSYHSIDNSMNNTMKTPAKFSQSRFSQSSPQLSTQHTIIKATQLSPVDDDIEMDVPRPYVDPSIDHRRKRTEFFKKPPLHLWLIENFHVVKESKPYFKEVWDAYKKAFPADMNASNGFLDAIHEAFPILREPPFPKSLKQNPLPRASQNQTRFDEEASRKKPFEELISKSNKPPPKW